MDTNQFAHTNGFLQIAIDGPAGAGKSSVARTVAQRLGILYLDTGAMYRALTWKALRHNIDFSGPNTLTQLALDTVITFDTATGRVLCDETDVTEAIRIPQVSENVSAVAAVPGVRARLTELQRNIARACPIVLDGRDIGSVVLPQATVKIFLTADLDRRAERRQKDLREQGLHVDLRQVERDIAARDDKDSNRSTAPLRQAPDAVLIDTSNMTFEEVVEEVLALVRRVMS
ncbi:MAG: (d)CMP kinase [Peptococcaceae bacterium]|nr:(d)CMP kinase [Peptococcaceae bacterium]